MIFWLDFNLQLKRFKKEYANENISEPLQSLNVLNIWNKMYLQITISDDKRT